MKVKVLPMAELQVLTCVQFSIQFTHIVYMLYRVSVSS